MKINRKISDQPAARADHLFQNRVEQFISLIVASVSLAALTLFV